MSHRQPRYRVALCTGASSGIGEALAAALAARGTHVLLAARSVPRLDALRACIEAAGGRATVIPADLGAPGAARQHVRLGRSVGCHERGGLEGHGRGEVEHRPPTREQPGHELAGECREGDDTDLQHVVEPVGGFGRESPVEPEARVVHQQVHRQANSLDVVEQPLSEALWAEYRGRGLRVVALCPGPVDTPFDDAAGPGARSTAVFRRLLTVADVVESAMAALEASGPTRIVGVRNLLMAQSACFSPRALTARISAALRAPAGASST